MTVLNGANSKILHARYTNYNQNKNMSEVMQIEIKKYRNKEI